MPASAGAKARDRDHDGLSNRYEVKRSHTNPRRRDSDRDGLSDGFEVRRSHTNPRRKDTDRDGLKDRFELKRSRTAPRRPDTDGDGLTDGFEVLRSHTSPLRRDTDGDGVSDALEIVLGSDPLALASEPGIVLAPPPPLPPLDATPPETTISGGPSGTVTTASASFTFTSSELLSSFECQLDAGAWGDCSSPQAYSSLANGSHTFNVRATDLAGNTDASPASRTWTVAVPPPADTTPPDTTITGGPSGTVTTASASFTFTATESGSSFECQLDAGAWTNCSSPKAYSSLANGSHTFKVRATDDADNTDASPASRSWTVAVPPPADTTPPDTTITGGPSGTQTTASASFTFTATESGSSFECQLDTGGWAACSSPKGYSGLANGSHTFKVRATDAADNTDATPASRNWTVDVSSPSGCAVATANVADGPDPWGGCFPGPSNTGVPTGTTLTTYTGPCTITAASTVIDGKTVNCSPLAVGSSASGLVIKNSRVNGGVIQDGGSASFTIQDSTIDNAVSYPACTAPSSCAAGKYACGDPNNATTECGVGYRNFTILRTEILNTNRAAYCESTCVIQDSYFHGTNLWPDHTNMAHASSTRVEQKTTLTHNSLACDYQGPFPNDDLGCSADISGYPDFAPINHNTITNNLMGSNNQGIGFCVYGGGTPGKPYSGDPTNATYVVYKDNVFQRGANGKCGAYGAVTSFVTGRTGNVWSGNVWDNGATVAAVN